MNNFSHFMGRDGFIWWIGVIEDRNDPDKIGRVRVRCLGYHTENKDDIPTEDLPWAHVILPPTAPYGALHNLVPGMWVMGFWKDPAFMQEPIVTGIIPGYPIETPDSTKGFNDPGGSDYGPYPTRTKEPDTSRLARSEKSIDQTEYKPHDEIAARDEKASKEIKVANDKESAWNELKTIDPTERGKSATNTTNVETLSSRSASNRRNPEYPYNDVYESESGHIFEIDDTPYAERLYRKHRTGTFEEIDADGNKVTRVIKDNYTIVHGNDYVYVKGNVNLTVDADCRTYIKGNWDIQVDGDKKEVIKGNVTEEYGTKIKEHTHNTKVTAKRIETVEGDTEENYVKKTETTSGDVTETYGGKQNTSVSGNRKLQSGAGIDMDAPTIQLN